MSPLEVRYRRWLRLLPRSYRAEREEEMVATFLETVLSGEPDEDERREITGRPSASEIVSIVGLAVRQRLGGTDAPPRASLWGAAVRRFALVGLLVSAVLGTSQVLQAAWLSRILPWPPVPQQLLLAVEANPELDPWTAVASLIGLLWVAAFVALITGRWRMAKVMAAVALVPALEGALEMARATVAGGGGPPPPSFSVPVATHLFVGCLVVLSLAAFHPDAPSISARSWVVGYVAGLVVALGPSAVAGISLDTAVLFEPAGLQAITLIVVGAVHLVVPAITRRPRDPAWSLALMLLVAVVLVQRLAGLLPAASVVMAGDRVGITAKLLAVGSVQAAGLLVLGALLVRASLRSLACRSPGNHDASLASFPDAGGD